MYSLHKSHIIKIIFRLVTITACYCIQGMCCHALLERNLRADEDFNKFGFKTIYLQTLDTIFSVDYIESTPVEGPNPFYPAIRIYNSDQQNDTWIQIIYTNSINKSLQRFIDAYEPIYPFYSIFRTFYDHPMWSPVGNQEPGPPLGSTSDILALRWEAHTYAIKKYQNILYIVGAIKWGYNFFHSEYYPRFVFPESLDKQTIRGDINYLLSMLPNLKLRIIGENIDKDPHPNNLINFD